MEGIKGTEEIERRCKDDCKIGFVLHPVDIDSLIEVADGGGNMPPKSTWFEPKPREGFIIRLFDTSNRLTQMSTN